ncbi:MAG: hypothetical protein LBB61_00590 [Treponema sp.]|jgi:hypothetical protein|nr:hypothetical protein [Treponema sp.]
MKRFWFAFGFFVWFQRAECMYSDPYLYILSTPFTSYIWMSRVFDSSSDIELLRY